MKLTKQLEKEVRQVYMDYWNRYMKGDASIIEFLGDDVQVIGSTESEVYRNKKEAADFFISSGGEIAGKVDFRNRNIDISSLNGYVLIIEMMDLYVLIEKEWVFYAKARLSSLFEKQQTGWKLIQLHGSLPDSRIQGEETISFESIRKENLELKEAVKRRTIELENKNRELEIEASLERVRTVAMAMKKPDDLLNICEVLFNELNALGFPGLRNALINTFGDNEEYFNDYDYSDFTGGYIARVSQTGHPAVEEYINRIRAANEIFSERVIEGDELTKWKKFRLDNGEMDDPRLDDIPALYYYLYAFGTAGIGISTFNPIPADKLEVLKRFRNVFEFAYRRYMDVTKAEAQTREAQIELALERVRARSMAMQKSDELSEAAQVLYNEFGTLGINTFTCGYMFIDEPSNTQTAWVVLPNGTLLPNFIVFPLTGDAILDNRFAAWKQKEPLHVADIKGEVNKQHHLFLSEHVPAQVVEDVFSKIPDRIIFYTANFSEGYLLILATDRFSVDDEKTIVRFANVFEQTYTRFLDLKRAEAQARESMIEAALERVRSRTLAMQKSDELAETAAVMFKQLILLGIEPSRIYIAIIEDDDGNVEFWITDEDAGKISTGFRTNLKNNRSLQKMFYAWRERKKSVCIDMQGEELREYFDHLSSLNVPFKRRYETKRRVQNIAFFSRGFIGIASPDEQPKETVLLLERFAAAFNLTYTRFNDLKIAKAHAIQAAEDLVKLQTEKKRAEDALNELQAAQKQLIQSEKMASLGELTAGIAHEIQNPLNFVNNFSEVSNELLDEMIDEVNKGNFNEVKEIMTSVRQNLEKISHHGKRADGIVKGMLQHSRTSTGQKEPTDMNVLADEYLRLAYHGLRAKDKTFNALMKTDYDTSMEKVNVIPQDMGRVILNLISNAFYVVNEKSKQGIAGYEPTVTVSTKKLRDHFEIKVGDNGDGIPMKVLDKIFQPFFTTKPTGQGTGLGLSLSYDIVKAHNGDLKVKTQEGEGTEFVIYLPIVE